MAEPPSAHLLAQRVSAILDIYEIKEHRRVATADRFLTAPMNLTVLWHPVLVMDEAHVSCPERGQAASSGAVVDVATCGRKREPVHLAGYPAQEQATEGRRSGAEQRGDRPRWLGRRHGARRRRFDGHRRAARLARVAPTVMADAWAEIDD